MYVFNWISNVLQKWKHESLEVGVTTESESFYPGTLSSMSGMARCIAHVVALTGCSSGMELGKGILAAEAGWKIKAFKGSPLYTGFFSEIKYQCS